MYPRLNNGGSEKFCPTYRIVVPPLAEASQTAVVGARTCYIPWDIQRTQNLIKSILLYGIGMFVPYSLIAIFNALIIYHMLKYRRLRAGMSASGDTKSDDSAQR